MTFDEKILSYDMTDHDKLLAEIADIIIEAYNGSYKPHIVQNLSNAITKHTPNGYSLLRTEQEHLPEPKTWVLTTDESISDYIEHSFLILGKTSVKWRDVEQSKAVLIALGKMFGIEIALTLNHSGDGYFPYSQVFAAWKGPGDMHKEMKEKGFTYFDRNFWEIRL